MQFLGKILPNNFTICKQSLGQGNVFAGVCQSFCPTGCLPLGLGVSASGLGVSASTPKHTSTGHTPALDTHTLDTPLTHTPLTHTPLTHTPLDTHPSWHTPLLTHTPLDTHPSWHTSLGIHPFPGYRHPPDTHPEHIPWTHPLDTAPPPDTPYGQQVGSTHPTGILSCFGNFLEDISPSCDWYPCFGLLVTSALGFKARVDPPLACFQWWIQGGCPRRAPLRTKLFLISWSFSENLANLYAWAPLLEGWRSLLRGILDLPPALSPACNGFHRLASMTVELFYCMCTGIEGTRTTLPWEILDFPLGRVPWWIFSRLNQKSRQFTSQFMQHDRSMCWLMMSLPTKNRRGKRNAY